MVDLNDGTWERLEPDHLRYWVSLRGEVYNKEYKRFITPEIVEGGYLRVRIDNSRYYVHKLVAEKFLTNPENKKYIVHLDGNKSNNHVCNLAWSNGFKVIS